MASVPEKSLITRSQSYALSTIARIPQFVLQWSNGIIVDKPRYWARWVGNTNLILLTASDSSGRRVWGHIYFSHCKRPLLAGGCT